MCRSDVKEPLESYCAISYKHDSRHGVGDSPSPFGDSPSPPATALRRRRQPFAHPVSCLICYRLCVLYSRTSEAKHLSLLGVGSNPEGIDVIVDTFARSRSQKRAAEKGLEEEVHGKKPGHAV